MAKLIKRKDVYMENSRRFSRLVSFLDQSVQEKRIPGVALAITSSEKSIFKYTTGFAHVDREIKMKEDTIFDLASLTKVVATLPSVLQLMDTGKLDIDDPVYYYIPEFKKNNNDITIKHLLTHASGYQPGIKFHLNNNTLEEAISIIGKLTDKGKTGNQVIYSDLNFIVLGYLVEQIAGVPLDKYTEEHIYKPLNMNDTCFNPPKEWKGKIAATEYMTTIKDYQWGAVHDENANHFNGVSGHAGLFSTIEDLSKFSRMILNGGKYSNEKVLSEQSIALSTHVMTKNLNLNRGLGWELFNTPSMSGQFIQHGFGHTGFTGTSIWFDPQKSVSIILLTNRVHFGRDTNIARFRRIVHNLAALAI